MLSYRKQPFGIVQSQSFTKCHLGSLEVID